MEDWPIMRKKIIVSSLILAVVLGMTVAAFAQNKPAGKAAATGKTPIAVIGNKVVNLGEVLEGQDYNYTFVIKNGGQAELQILSVRPG